jgi:hypothetical protein
MYQKNCCPARWPANPAGGIGIGLNFLWLLSLLQGKESDKPLIKTKRKKVERNAH